MKIFKYITAFSIIIILMLTVWFFYPKFEILKMKKQSEQASAITHSISYLDYLRSNENTELYHLAIGDSIILEVGAKENQDFTSLYTKQLKFLTDKEIHVINKGKSGFTSSELKNMITSGSLDGELTKSDIITINIGGNDILKTVKQQNAQNMLQKYDELQTSFSHNLQIIFNYIRELNTDAIIVCLELYNPLHPSDPIYSLSTQFLPNWNVNIYKISNLDGLAVVVETTKVINGNKLQNLSSDGIHPNAHGYLAISNQIITQLTNESKKK